MPSSLSPACPPARRWRLFLIHGMNEAGAAAIAELGQWLRERQALHTPSGDACRSKALPRHTRSSSAARWSVTSCSTPVEIVLFRRPPPGAEHSATRGRPMSLNVKKIRQVQFAELIEFVRLPSIAPLHARPPNSEFRPLHSRNRGLCDADHLGGRHTSPGVGERLACWEPHTKRSKYLAPPCIPGLAAILPWEGAFDPCREIAYYGGILNGA
jgi:hypothetical protein